MMYNEVDFVLIENIYKIYKSEISEYSSSDQIRVISLCTHDRISTPIC